MSESQETQTASKQAEALSPELQGVYKGSKYLDMLNSQKIPGIKAALFTDIDLTFFRQDRADASKKLFNDLSAENYPTVAVTGNDIATIKRKIDSGILPHFPIIVGSAGTEIWVLQEGAGIDYQKDSYYESTLHEIGFNRDRIATQATTLIEELKTEKPKWFLNFQHLDPTVDPTDPNAEKPLAYQPFKVSFYAYASTPKQLSEIKNRVQAGFPDQKIVIADESNYNGKLKPNEARKKYCIDIVPATKADAVADLAQRSGVNLKVVAGNDVNDADVLKEVGDISIIVGGSTENLLQTIKEAIPKDQTAKHFARIKDEQGNLKKLYYREKDPNKLGPESIQRATRHLKVLKAIRDRIVKTGR